MLQQVRIGKWLIEADVKKSRKFYNKEIELCNCIYCKNYIRACKHLKFSVLDLFNKLGIHPAKPAHLSEFPTDEDGIRLYIGGYFLVGRLLEGELCTDSNFHEINTFTVENFIFGFSKDIQFIPEGFPSPVLQLSFEAKIPWILEEKP